MATRIEMLTQRLIGVAQTGFGILSVQVEFTDLYTESHALCDDR